MIGQTISHYRILGKLGAGGMGEVFLAEDTKLHRQVALKFLPKNLTADWEARERFEREAQAAAALNHPNIVTVYEIGEHQGQVFIAMEYVEGGTLKEMISGDEAIGVGARRAVPLPITHRPLPITQVIEIAVQLASGLAAAHAKGIVHRDVKPQNILVDKDNHVKILDFGLAKLKGVSSLTKESSTLGTIHYMSPEQTMGKEVDHRTDIWSLGVVLYEMLTGKLPFQGDYEQAVIYSILNEEPTRMTAIQKDVPPEFDRILDKALAKEPGKRHASAADIIKELRGAASDMKSPEGAENRSVPSIAVLPFENLSPDPDNAYFADGLTEELIADLSKVRALRIISRTSAMKYKGTTKGIPEIARELRIDHVLEGSVRKAGNSLRITAKLIEVATDTHLWAEKYTGTLQDVFDLQERLSRQIVDALKVKLTPDEEQRLAMHATSDPRVYEAWLYARHSAYQTTQEGFEEAMRIVNQALATMGDHAILHAAQGIIYYLAYDFGFSHDEDTLRRCEAAASRALDLNPDLPQALLAKGLTRYKRGDTPGFVRHLRRALAAERNSEVLGWLAFVLAEVGLTAEARACAEETRARDPLFFMGLLGLPVVELFDGRFHSSVREFRSWIALGIGDPAFTQWWLGQALAYGGQDSEAIEEFERGVAAGSGLLADMCALGARAMRGDRQGTVELFESNLPLQEGARSDETFPRYISGCFAHVGEIDLALEWLERAIDWGFTNHKFLTDHDRFFAALRGNSRFLALMERARSKQQEMEA